MGDLKLRTLLYQEREKTGIIFLQSNGKDGLRDHDVTPIEWNLHRSINKQWMWCPSEPPFGLWEHSNERTGAARLEAPVRLEGQGSAWQRWSLHYSQCAQVTLPFKVKEASWLCSRFLLGMTATCSFRDDAVEMWLRRVSQYAEPPSITNLTAHGTSPKRYPRSTTWWTNPSAELLQRRSSPGWQVSEVDDTGGRLQLGHERVSDDRRSSTQGACRPCRCTQQAWTVLLRLKAASSLHFQVVTRCLRLGPMHADATIVNYYPPKSTLSPHVDRWARYNLWFRLQEHSFWQDSLLCAVFTLPLHLDADGGVSYGIH